MYTVLAVVGSSGCVHDGGYGEGYGTGWVYQGGYTGEYPAAKDVHL